MEQIPCMPAAFGQTAGSDHPVCVTLAPCGGKSGVMPLTPLFQILFLIFKATRLHMRRRCSTSHHIASLILLWRVLQMVQGQIELQRATSWHR